MEKGRSELSTAVTCNMEGHAMLGKDMCEEELGDLRGVDLVMGQDTDQLFACAIDDVEDRGMAVRRRKLFYKVEGDGMPRAWWDRQLLDKAIQMMLWFLVMFAGSAAVNVILNISMNVWPAKVPGNQRCCPALTRMPSGGVVVAES